MTTILTIFLFSLIVALLLTPFAGLLGRWGEAIDKPDGIRKHHQKPTPRTGGIALFATFVLTIFAAGFIKTDVTQMLQLLPQKWVLVAAGMLVFGVGLWDDYQRLNHRIKFLVQILAASMVYASGYGISKISGLDWTLWPVISYGLTVFWILLFINAVNLLDGLDGLSAGVCFFCCLVMTILSITRKDLAAACFFACLCGTILGFLRYNSNPARIFMGDGGSYFLGFTIAVISLVSSAKSQTGTAMLIPILAMGVPMFDTILSPIRRFFMGRSPFKPDRGHIHHKLVGQFSFSTQRVVLIIYAITAGLCMLALILVNMKDEFAVLVFALLGGTAFMFIQKLGYLDHIDLERIATWGRDINYVSGLSKDRRSFLNLQMNVAGSNDDKEFWANVCEVLDWLHFDHAELSKKKPGGDSVVHLWSQEDFDDCRGMCRQYLLKLELPLVDDKGYDHGTLWLLKDVRRKPISQHTFFRVEQLRRTIENALKTMKEIQVVSGMPVSNKPIRDIPTPILVE